MYKTLNYLVVYLFCCLFSIPSFAQSASEKRFLDLVSHIDTWQLRRYEMDDKMYNLPEELVGQKMTFVNGKTSFTYFPNQTKPVSLMEFRVKSEFLVTYSNSEFNAYHYEIDEIFNTIKLRDLSDPRNGYFVWEPSTPANTSGFNFVQPEEQNSFWTGTAKSKDLFKKINGKLKMVEGSFFFYELGEIPITVEKHFIDFDKNSGITLSYVLSKKEKGKLSTTYLYNFAPADIEDIVEVATHKDSPVGIAQVNFKAHMAFKTDYSTKDDKESSVVKSCNFYFLKLKDNSFQELKNYILELKKENLENPGKLNKYIHLVSTDTFWESYKGSSNKYTLYNAGVLSDRHIYLTFRRVEVRSDGGNSNNGYMVKIPVSNLLSLENPEAHKAEPYTRFPKFKGILEYYEYDSQKKIFVSRSDYNMRFPIFVELDDEDYSLSRWITFLFQHLGLF